jgi:hypothetical protein
MRSADRVGSRPGVAPQELVRPPTCAGSGLRGDRVASMPTRALRRLGRRGRAGGPIQFGADAIRPHPHRARRHVPEFPVQGVSCFVLPNPTPSAELDLKDAQAGVPYRRSNVSIAPAADTRG